MKTEKEIIEQMKQGKDRGMHKLYLNGLLYCLGRDDLCVGYGKRLTEKRFNKIVKELEENGNKDRLIKAAEEYLHEIKKPIFVC